MQHKPNNILTALSLFTAEVVLSSNPGGQDKWLAEPSISGEFTGEKEISGGSAKLGLFA
ncbi:hypothetical protein RND71_017707 [Anisodus tanguticus]|uniref:Uncharacterized protein n=1 Tax=Anisodus tanguticus TaxID=243964 RepID=A0AAE1S4N4_9SOLA|nr:hypothetical protein RND71_017707 [Anisodus tanguticus]